MNRPVFLLLVLVLLPSHVVVGFAGRARRIARRGAAPTRTTHAGGPAWVSLSMADMPDMEKVGVVVLAGGTGSRMKASMPKQFLSLGEKPILHHSLQLFLETLPAKAQQQGVRGPRIVALVLDPQYQPEYQHFIDRYEGRLVFANPGEERQGSVENGLSQIRLAAPDCDYVAIHDSARPLVTLQEVSHVVADAFQHGAAVLGVPCKATIKESQDTGNDEQVFVQRTIPRSKLWEVHTPQVIRIETLVRGFQLVQAQDLQVTDDVSIVEALGEPVKITKGEYTNLKITTPEDLDVAEAILRERSTVPESS